ncbi:MAG: glycosyltransferase 87 family protein [Thermoanaerobaculia bacterium]
MTSSPPDAQNWASRTVPPHVILLSGLVFGSLLRAAQIATSLGTVDVANWLRHLVYVHQLGVLRCYTASSLINHPTLALEIAYWSWRIGGSLHLAFYDAFRILMSLADVVTAIALYAIAKRVAPDNRVALALFFFLSPAAIFISAFHCNSDPLMVMLIVLAILACAKEKPVLAGLLIGAAAGIKIIAFIVVPFIVLAFPSWRLRVRAAIAAALVDAAIFVPPVIAVGRVALRNVFGYQGWPEAWGLRIILNLARRAFPTFAIGDPASILTPILLLSLVAVALAETIRAWKRGIDTQRLVLLTGFLFLLVLSVAPGFAVQYLMWVLPFLAFVLPRRFAIVPHALISIFLFIVYTSWTGGEWPWTWADASKHEAPPWIGMFGLVVWASICWTTFVAARTLYATRTLHPQKKTAGSSPAA